VHKCSLAIVVTITVTEQFKIYIQFTIHVVKHNGLSVYDCSKFLKQNV